MTNFPRIERLPPYVFNITGELKMAARRRGEDIIDMSMGNPDGPTPKHIVDKLIEVASRPDTHGYSVSKGIPRLRKAISGWYDRRYGVQIDPDSEAIVTIGSKEGLAHLMLATLDRVHTPGRATAAAIEAREAGFRHVSLDLIYGTPGESDDDWAATLEAALGAEPDHISAYALTLERGSSSRPARRSSISSSPNMPNAA